jgi:DtxR family Mn-dependent transcriptional regulator
MVRRLADDGYLTRTGRGVTLTDQGAKLAASVVRHHRLAERFLVDVVGLPWSRAHLEAGRWEHVISDEVEARFVAILGNPATCPHGNPIPGAPVDPTPQRPLSDVPAGEHVRITRITEQVEMDGDALAYLDANGLVPGCRVSVVARAPDGTVMLTLGNGDTARSAAVGTAMCAQIFVTDD